MAQTRHAPTRAQLAALARRDPALGDAIRRVPSFPGFPTSDQARLSNYAYLARAIVYQQLSGKAAATIWKRAVALGGRSFPDPRRMAQLTDEDLRGAGLSRAKVAALRGLAHAVEGKQIRLAGLARHPDGRIVEELVALRGIGEWTAQMFLIFKLGRLDVLPATDLGVQEGLRRLDGLPERPTAQELRERGRCWQPLSSVAAWTLWRLTDER
ncbi:MAG: DNA-3-methyladenine glycosylase 2 family protein [Planctomycetaceae bacterium]|nr:DNA-3-methyladenine glycosylase 2 family protein [Planctomycetaceae bacterium]